MTTIAPATQGLVRSSWASMAAHLLIQAAYHPIADWYWEKGANGEELGSVADGVYRSLLSTPHIDKTPIILNVGLGGIRVIEVDHHPAQLVAGLDLEQHDGLRTLFASAAAGAAKPKAEPASDETSADSANDANGCGCSIPGRPTSALAGSQADVAWTDPFGFCDFPANRKAAQASLR